MVLKDQGIFTPFPVCNHNLNHVSVFPLTLRLSCLPLCWHVLAYSSPTPYPTRCVDLSTYVILSFCDSHQSFLIVFFLPKFFQFPSPPCLVSHFSLFTLLFTLPDFLQQLASPACLYFSPCVASVLCGRTGESDWRGECAVLPTTIPDSTVPERREATSKCQPNPRLYST